MKKYLFLTFLLILCGCKYNNQQTVVNQRITPLNIENGIHYQLNESFELEDNIVSIISVTQVDEKRYRIAIDCSDNELKRTLFNDKYSLYPALDNMPDLETSNYYNDEENEVYLGNSGEIALFNQLVIESNRGSQNELIVINISE